MYYYRKELIELANILRDTAKDYKEAGRKIGILDTLEKLELLT